MRMDGQPNRISILDVFGAAVNGLLHCISLDHRAIWVSTVMDISVQCRHEALVRPHLVQVHRPKVLYLIDHVHHQVWHDIEVKGGKPISTWQIVSAMNCFMPGGSASSVTFCVVQLKK